MTALRPSQADLVKARKTVDRWIGNKSPYPNQEELEEVIAQALAERTEECALIAEGPIFKDRYRGHDDHNWQANPPPHTYGAGRIDAAAAIRATLSGQKI